MIALKNCLLVPLTTTLVGSMLKVFMFEAALIKTIPMSVPLGTPEDGNLMFISLMIDPLL